jgi:monofunctional biosynthetic peptidoglycan transglycosylase
VIRKALEIPMALWMDVVWSKRRLMEIYLNIAEWAPGIYGVEAAAQAYFGVSASKLSARQSALLAVTLPNPIKRNAANPSQGHAAAGRNHRGSRPAIRRIHQMPL